MPPAWRIACGTAEKRHFDYVRAVARQNLVDVLFSASVGALRDNVDRHLPAGAARDYFHAGLDPAWPGHAGFLRAIGLRQLVRLAASLADGLVDDALAAKAADLLARLVVFQTYEIISDELAHGLAGADGDRATNPAAPTSPINPADPADPISPISPADPANPANPASPASPADPASPDGARRRLVHGFNAAMTTRLRATTPAAPGAAALLAPWRGDAAGVSRLGRSVAGPAHRRLLADLPTVPADNVDRDVWAVLVANVEAGAEVVDTVTGSPLAGLVRAGLLERYAALDRTLSAPYLSRLEIAQLSAQTVLVVPTLAYCVAVLADLTHPVPGLVAAVDDGALPTALYDAAMVTRLLNDLGTALLRPDGADRRAAVRRLRADPGAGLAAALAGPGCARLAKDLAYGEFNVCLYAARRSTAGAKADAPAGPTAGAPAGPTADAAADALAADLEYFAGLYRLHRRSLAAGLARLTGRLGEPRPATRIARFVRFHERMYARPYDDPAGDYTS
jgi:hypothetical protein